MGGGDENLLQVVQKWAGGEGPTTAPKHLLAITSRTVADYLPSQKLGIEFFFSAVRILFLSMNACNSSCMHAK